MVCVIAVYQNIFETESTIHDIRYYHYATMFQYQGRSCIAMCKHLPPVAPSAPAKI